MVVIGGCFLLNLWLSKRRETKALRKINVHDAAAHQGGAGLHQGIERLLAQGNRDRAASEASMADVLASLTAELRAIKDARVAGPLRQEAEQRETIRERRDTAGGLGAISEETEEDMRASKAAKKAARKLARKSKRKGKGHRSRRKRQTHHVHEEEGGGGHEDGAGGRRGRRRGSVERMQIAMDAERARRAVADAAAVAVEVELAGGGAAARVSGRAKLRWMNAARQVIAQNKKQKALGQRGSAAPGASSITRRKKGLQRKATLHGADAMQRGQQQARGPAKPNLARQRSGTLSIMELDELHAAARDADRQGVGKRPQMVRRKSGSVGVV